MYTFRKLKTAQILVHSGQIGLSTVSVLFSLLYSMPEGVRKDLTLISTYSRNLLSVCIWYCSRFLSTSTAITGEMLSHQSFLYWCLTLTIFVGVVALHYQHHITTAVLITEGHNSYKYSEIILLFIAFTINVIFHVIFHGWLIHLLLVVSFNSPL